MKDYFKKRTYKQKISDAKKRYQTETKVRQHLIRTEKEYFIQPVESHITGIGIPDLFLKHKVLTLTFWAELKTVKRKVVTSISPDWRPGQLNWARNYLIANGKWLLIIAVNDKLYFTNIPEEKYYLEELNEFVSLVDMDFLNYMS